MCDGWVDSPMWSRISPTAAGSLMKAMMRMDASQIGHCSGNASWMRTSGIPQRCGQGLSCPILLRLRSSPADTGPQHDDGAPRRSPQKLPARVAASPARKALAGRRPEPGHLATGAFFVAGLVILAGIDPERGQRAAEAG
jgi:hypothetical protein